MNEFQKCVINESIHPVFVPFFKNRGIKTCDALFKILHPDIDQLHSPFLMKDMDSAVARLKKAISLKEKIMVYGDYDVDGITSTSLLLRIFKKLGNEALYYIPNRIEDGYGMNMEGIRYAKEKGVDLIITVDCGIKAIEQVKYAHSLGIDVIITDHHLPGDELPPAAAILNPHRKDDEYPFKDLSGVGVAFKLLHGILDKQHQDSLLWNLDLVALGTLADSVYLYDENRIFVKFGLRILEKGKNIGLCALKEQIKLLSRKITENSIAFELAPRLNSAGRLGEAEAGVKLLVTDDIKIGRKLVSKIETMNLTRKKIQNRMVSEAANIIRMQSEPINVVYSRNWHRGVMGIVASRLVEEFNEPFIVLTVDRDTAYGSGRSIGPINIMGILDENKGLILKYGGHPQACGITIEEDKLPEFSKRFTQGVQERLNNISYPSHRRDLKVDNELLLTDIDDKFINSLDMLSPFGEGFSSPVFLIKDVKICGNKNPVICQGDKKMKIHRFSIRNIPQNKNVNIIGNIDLDEDINKPVFRIMNFSSSAVQK